MIENLKIVNFRAFKNENFEFSKLNIFVGPNNSGKSSAISAINALAQTVTAASVGGGAIVLNGQFDQLGTFKDLVHGGRSSTPVKISFKIKEYCYYLEFKYRSQRKEIELSRYKLSYLSESIYEYSVSNDVYNIFIFGNKIEDFFPGIRKKRPRIIGLVPASFLHSLFITKAPEVSEQLLDKVRELERHLFKARRQVGELFKNFDSLGPFRKVPERTYMFTGEVASHVGRAGENAAKLLASDSSKRGGERVGFVEHISRWLKATEIAQGLKVRGLTERHYELSIVGKDGCDHNICDVGFGCSQVLPVLIAGIKHKHGKDRMHSNVLVLQEPEIHLHPNAQAALGSFISDISNSNGQVFVETHSDNLILRVARHVALGDLRPDDVRIFYVNDDAGVKSVNSISISSEGAFLPNWPEGFFPQRQAESLALARAAMGRVAEKSRVEFVYPEEIQ